MGTYADPRRWSDKTRRLDDKRLDLRKKVDDAADAQKINRVFSLTEKQKAEVDAIDHVANVRESEAEDIEQRIADEYPSGTKVFDRKSRNKAGYGKPKKFASGGMVGCDRNYSKR